MVTDESPLERLERKRMEQWDRDNTAFNERIRQGEQRRTHVELERIKRIEASGLSEEAYAIQQILQISRNNPDAEFYQVSLNKLGFRDSIDSMVDARKFFRDL